MLWFLQYAFMFKAFLRMQKPPKKVIFHQKVEYFRSTKCMTRKPLLRSEHGGYHRYRNNAHYFSQSAVYNHFLLEKLSCRETFTVVIITALAHLAFAAQDAGCCQKQERRCHQQQNPKACKDSNHLDIEKQSSKVHNSHHHQDLAWFTSFHTYL